MKKSKLIITVLMLGGLWGLLEATLGTLLHLPAVHAIMFFASTAILLPIAYLVTGRAYKVTGCARSAIYVGLVAAAIKSISFVFGMPVQYVINPMVAIVMESVVMAVALKVAKPKSIISVKSFLTFVVASTAFRVAYVGYSMATAEAFGSAYLVGGSIVWSEIVKYVVTTNAISFVYVAGFMLAGLGIKALAKRPNFAKITAKVQHFAYSPVCAALMVCLAVVSTLFLK